MSQDSSRTRHLALTMTGAGPAFFLPTVGWGAARSARPTASGRVATPSPALAGERHAPTSAAGHQIVKILVVLRENDSTGTVFPTHRPHPLSLAGQLERATSSSDLGHPSLPNYPAISDASAVNDHQNCFQGPGCIGFHASPLSRYRGRTAVNWAILRGEMNTGNTMMHLDIGTDTREVIDQRRPPIGPEDARATVCAGFADAGAAMLRQRLPAIPVDTAPHRPHSPATSEVPRQRTPQMGIVDWGRPAQRGLRDDRRVGARSRGLPGRRPDRTKEGPSCG
jgi:Formyl transferase